MPLIFAPQKNLAANLDLWLYGPKVLNYRGNLQLSPWQAEYKWRFTLMKTYLFCFFVMFKGGTNIP